MGDVNTANRVKSVCNVELPSGFVVRGRTSVVNGPTEYANSVSGGGNEDYYAPVLTDFTRSCSDALQQLEAKRNSVLATGWYSNPPQGPIPLKVEICDDQFKQCGVFAYWTLSEAISNFATSHYDAKGHISKF